MGINGESPLSFAARAANAIARELELLGRSPSEANITVWRLEKGADVSGSILVTRQGYGYLFTDGYPVGEQDEEELWSSFRILVCEDGDWPEVPDQVRRHLGIPNEE